MTEPTGRRIVKANHVEICLQTFGNPADPAVLLVSGASTSMDMWPVPLCERIAAGGRHVVRYDLRDTGESMTYGAGQPPYTILDLADDTVGILDALGIEQAQVVGMSMGGVIAQLAALRHPGRVRTLTLVATTPAVEADEDRLLPSMTTADTEAFGALSAPDWDDVESTVSYLVAGERLCAARSVPFDEETTRTTMFDLVSRSRDIRAIENHFALADVDVADLSLGQITAPTLVLHGDEDPLFPLEHARALVAEIPGARLVVLSQVGHEVPARVFDELTAAVMRNLG